MITSAMPFLHKEQQASNKLIDYDYTNLDGIGWLRSQ
jgi:hypothetical protein